MGGGTAAALSTLVQMKRTVFWKNGKIREENIEGKESIFLVLRDPASFSHAVHTHH